MQLNDARPNVEVLGDMEEQFFSISDLGMIFNILRNKMYSNAVLAVCREYACNARDAHREVSTPDQPIQITLPTYLDKSYKIKDWGPGISPDRMENIFIKYTASTKRHDNTQHGGFGLGCKSAFAYTDSFSVITVYNGIRYVYNCFIDPTKIGKIALSSKTATDESNSTEIIVPVLDKDFTSFNVQTEIACRHWTVKPTVKGGDIHWQVPKKVLEGNDWAIAQSSDYYSRHCKVVIDGIEYPLELDTIRKWADPKVIDAARGNMILYFGVGQLALSANREQLSLDEPTQACIRARLSEVVKDIKQKVQVKIDTFDNLWDANLYYRKSLKEGFNELKFLGGVKWQGIDINDEYIKLTGCQAFLFTKGYSGRGKDPNKLTRHATHNFQFDNNTAVYLNNLSLKDPTPKHVRKAFDDDPTLKSLLLIVPNDTMTEQVLNDTIHLNKMNVKYLSTITKANSRKYTPAASRLLIFKFDVASCVFRQVSYASLDDDSNLKVLCKTTKSYDGSRRCTFKNDMTLSFGNLQGLARKFNSYSFYGVDDSVPQKRLTEEFSEFVDVEDFIDEVAFPPTIHDTFVELKVVKEHARSLDEKLAQHGDEWRKVITSAKSPLLKAIAIHEKFKTICTQDPGHLLYLYEALKGEITENAMKEYLKLHPEVNMVKLNKETAQRYPLLQYINHYNMNQEIAAFSEYVNLVDKDKP